MHIQVATRFNPFSHLPGATCLIPGTQTLKQVFPSKSFIKTYEGEVLNEGPGQKTLFQNLEKPFRMERLSFGVHKSQDVDKIRRRQDLKEILPLWFKLGSFYSQAGEVNSGSLLYELLRRPTPDLLLKAYLSGFSSFFVPRARDLDFHGFELPPLQDEDPFLLLSLGYQAIKRMIVEEKEEVWILPHLPTCFHAGRLVETPIAQGWISIEWTKHFLRRVVFEGSDEVHFRFPKEVRRYRVKATGKRLYFDNFQA